MDELETLQQCEEHITQKSKDKFGELSTSQNAEWLLWLKIIAFAVWVFNKCLNIFKQKVEATVKEERRFGISWYLTMIKAFQLGYTLRQNPDGTTSYDIIDSEARIIKQVSIRETVDGLSIKVAKEVDGELKGLDKSTDEFLQFKRYVEARKAPGTKTDLVTLDADILKYTLDVYFNPLYVSTDSNDSVTNNVRAKLNEYRNRLDYTGIVYVSELERKICEANGVVTAKIKSITGTQGAEVTDFDVRYVLKSGYFNYDVTSIINMIQA